MMVWFCPLLAVAVLNVFKIFLNAPELPLRIYLKTLWNYRARSYFPFNPQEINLKSLSSLLRKKKVNGSIICNLDNDSGAATKHSLHERKAKWNAENWNVTDLNIGKWKVRSGSECVGKIRKAASDGGVNLQPFTYTESEGVQYTVISPVSLVHCIIGGFILCERFSQCQKPLYSTELGLSITYLNQDGHL